MILYLLTHSSKVQLFLWAVPSMKPSTKSPSMNLNARCGLWLQHQKQLQSRISFLSFIANTSWTLHLLHSQRGLSWERLWTVLHQLLKISKAELWFLRMTRNLNVLYKCMKFRWNTSNGYQVIEHTRNSIANDQRGKTPKHSKQSSCVS